MWTFEKVRDPAVMFAIANLLEDWSLEVCWPAFQWLLFNGTRSDHRRLIPSYRKVAEDHFDGDMRRKAYIMLGRLADSSDDFTEESGLVSVVSILQAPPNKCTSCSKAW